MKTRIIEIVDSYNNSTYIPQYKFYFWWLRFQDLHGLDIKFDSLDQAKGWLIYNPCKQVIVHAN